MPTKKHIKPGKIEPSSDGSAIVVHFTTVITHLDDDGQPGHVEKSPDKREIPVAKAMKGLGLEDIPALAKEIVERCKYIPATKTHRVEEVLERLLTANGTGAPAGSLRAPSPDAEEISADDLSPQQHPSAGSSGPSPKATPRRHENKLGIERAERRPKDRAESEHRPEGRRSILDDERRGGSMRPPREEARRARKTHRLMPADFLPRASLHEMDDYADELYEESMVKKAEGARRLLRLCLEPQQLGALVDHPTILGVLSRELRENAKRSHELAVAITGILTCLARFAHFHPRLVQHEVADASLRVLEYECKRRAVLQKELKVQKQQAQQADKGEGVVAEVQQNLKREEKKYKGLMERQDRLTLLCLLVLQDLCQDTKVEARLAAQNLCRFVAPQVARPADELVMASLGFLQKLSIYVQNKDVLVQSTETLARLADLAGHQNVAIAALSLRVCHNLSFDQAAREKFATQTSLVERLLTAAQQPTVRKVALKLLYQLSSDQQLRSTLATRYPGCVVFALKLVGQSKGEVDLDTLALCVNLAGDEACAALMLEERELFPKVVFKAMQQTDPLALKIARSVASHRGIHRNFLGVMSEAPNGDPQWILKLLRLAESSRDRPDVLVESLGILSGLNCTSPEVPWPELCDAGLLELLHRHLIVGFAEDDVVLEAVQITGILALDPGSASMLAGSQVPQDIPALLLEKGQDVDLAVQLLFTLRCLLLQDECSDLVLQAPASAAKGAMDALRKGRHAPHALQALQAVADEVLELILLREAEGGRDRMWSHRIKEFRFELHNEEWCQRLRKPHPDAKAMSPSKTNRKSTLGGAEGHSWAGATSLADRVWGLRAEAALE